MAEKSAPEMRDPALGMQPRALPDRSITSVAVRHVIELLGGARSEAGRRLAPPRAPRLLWQLAGNPLH